VTRTDKCFVCGKQAVAAGSALNPGGPVCYTHSWASDERTAIQRFAAAVRAIADRIREADQ
jgi:hypothetical protein